MILNNNPKNPQLIHKTMKLPRKELFPNKFDNGWISAFMTLFLIIERKMNHVLFSPNPIKGK